MEWINVKDRLPNDDERICMVCATEQVGDHTGTSRAWAFFDDGTDAKGNPIEFFREFYGDALISNVTHWMPLPELPKQ
jgi:hypothetical protein